MAGPLNSTVVEMLDEVRDCCTAKQLDEVKEACKKMGKPDLDKLCALEGDEYISKTTSDDVRKLLEV